MAAPRYAIIQWSDLWTNIINLETVKVPRKDVSLYIEGEYIWANSTKQLYEARISKISEDRESLAKLKCKGEYPVQYPYKPLDAREDSQKMRCESNVAEPQKKKQGNTTATEPQKKKQEQRTDYKDSLNARSESNRTETQKKKGGNDTDAAPQKSKLEKITHYMYKDSLNARSESNLTEPQKKKEGNDTVAAPQKSKLDYTLTQQSQLLKRKRESSYDESLDSNKTDHILEEIKKIKKRLKELERANSQPVSSPKPLSPAMKRSSSPPVSPQVSMPVSPPVSTPVSPDVSSSTFNGKTLDNLRDLICHTDSLYECVHTLLLALFSTEYIITHSVTGQRANVSTPAKPKFDGRLYNAMVALIKEKMSVKDTDITQKVQNVQKKYVLKYKINSQ